MVDEIAEDVEFALLVAVDRGDLNGGHHPETGTGAGCESLLDPADGVVVAQGEQLDAGVGGALDDLGGRERAIGAGRMCLQVEAEAHRAAGYAIGAPRHRSTGQGEQGPHAQRVSAAAESQATAAADTSPHEVAESCSRRSAGAATSFATWLSTALCSFETEAW